jgi:hypothetical protein
LIKPIAVWLVVGVFLAARAAAQEVPKLGLGPPEIRQDVHSPTIDVASARPESHAAAKDEVEVYMLVGKVDRKTGETSVAVQWMRAYMAPDWRNYQRAADSSGTPLVFETAKRSKKGCNAGSCTFSELYNIYFTKEQVSAAIIEGLDFNVWDRDGGSAVVKIPASEIKDFAAKMVEAEKLAKR